MSLNAKDYVKKYEPAPVGIAIARCFQVIDLGWQQTHYGSFYKIAMSWELLDKRLEDGKPFIVSREYRHSYHEKAKLFIHLCQWYGRELSIEELETFHLSAVIGKACWLNIIQVTNKSTGKISAKVDSILPLPASVPCPAPVNKPLVFSLDDATEVEYQALPQYLQKKITWPPPKASIVEPTTQSAPAAANPMAATQAFYAAATANPALPAGQPSAALHNPPIPTFNPAIEDVSEKVEFDDDVPF